ncbi:hypothetical protein [Thermoactinomyces sp. CICC 10522]|uniref:hypothetical protein n=1 Tax=Thermoactinomyces sp. CICC 10522 TaxID=2767427 RepID=UPI0018DEB98B|nr:hypothetical protein [Thermoactinomyces sp. CICC 10522]MBH8605914.1 hypothetical protein [Thermoactinomyces sp. CICC 10522]
MNAPDLKGTIAFISSFTDLFMLFAAFAIVMLTFIAIWQIGFKGKKPVKVFTQYFVRVLSLWLISSCLIVVVAAHLMSSLWDGILLVIDMVGDKLAEAAKGAL